MADVQVFEHANFQGRSQALPKGRYDDALKQITIGNDTLSSLQVPKGLVVRLYEHFHFQGRFIETREDTPAITLSWNDRASSIIVYGATEPQPMIKEVMIFEHANYGGKFQLLPIGKHDAAKISIGKTLSSALIPYGVMIRLFDQPNFQGASFTLRADTPAISLDWNDRAVSMIVEAMPATVWHVNNTNVNFNPVGTGKGYVGVPDANAGFGAGELLLFGGPGTKTSLWAGANRSVTLATDGNIGIGTEEPISKLHILSGAKDPVPRLETAPGNSGFFAAGWDFYPEGKGKGYVGVPDSRAGFGAGEMMLLGGTDTKTSLWAGYNRGLTVTPSGNVGIGTADPRARLEVNGNILTTGDIDVAGDIRLTNADCAEDFTIGLDVAVEPGTVMVVGAEGTLFPCQQAYDKRVAGVVSGAGDYKPGIVLDKQVSDLTRQPIALVGKVFCQVDAQYGAIAVGDLLTTSPTMGHAMKATKPSKAFGAVIGKALRSLKDGTGLIPILIALQ